MSESRPRSSSAEDERPPTKARRIARACLQCRSRKQRCRPSSPGIASPAHTHSVQEPCARCRELEITCSFETDVTPGPEENPTPSKMAQMVVDLQRRVNTQEARLAVLEHAIGNVRQEEGRSREASIPGGEIVLLPETVDFMPAAVPTIPDHIPLIVSSHVQSDNDLQTIRNGSHHPRSSPSADFSMNTLELGAPIATLRSLGALSNDPAQSSTQSLTRHQVQHPRSNNRADSALDPIARGVLSENDARRAIEIFFTKCHSMAPVLDMRLSGDGLGLRQTSIPLFLAVCAIGTRFWDDEYASRTTHDHPHRGLHPSFLELTTLLDIAVSQLLLGPTPADVTLDSIRALLLYAQWMPFNRNTAHSYIRPPHDQPTPKSRYNDISAWAVLGLAGRYALFLGLDRTAVAPFQCQEDVITEADMSRLRVWHNLLTCDFNLMLTSGLPASFDPGPAASVRRSFAGHRLAQQPEDRRVTALVELVNIAHRAIRSSSDSAGRHLEPSSLRRANFELDEWEQTWLYRLKDTKDQHNALPFTSVRWYRLTLNSASLAPFLSSSQTSRDHLEVSMLQSLEISLTASAQMLLALSTVASSHCSKIDSQSTKTFPTGSFEADPAAIETTSYAVDYTWVSLTFAVTFAVLCYVRGAIDDDLQICTLRVLQTQTRCPLPARSTSLLSRLVNLGQAIFAGVCRTSSVHPARDYQAIVINAAALISNPARPEQQESYNPLSGSQGDNGMSGLDVATNDGDALQSLFDMMSGSGMEWPGYLFGGSTETNGEWGSDLLNDSLS